MEVNLTELLKLKAFLVGEFANKRLVVNTKEILDKLNKAIIQNEIPKI